MDGEGLGVGGLSRSKVEMFLPALHPTRSPAEPAPTLPIEGRVREDNAAKESWVLGTSPRMTRRRRPG